MSISDLTGTTWVIHDTPQQDSLLELEEYSINFVSNESNYTLLRLTNDFTEDVDIEYNSTKVWNGWTASPNAGSWTNAAYKIINITGGIDATNADLITWLEDNATQVIDYPTYTYDLTQLSLAAGTHSITAKAKKAGYIDSDASNAVSYTVQAGFQASINCSSPYFYPQGNSGDSDVDVMLDGVKVGTIYYDIGSRTYNEVYGTGSVLSFECASSFDGIVVTMGGNTYNINNSHRSLTLTADAVITEVEASCLTGDTLVTMADHTTKRIDEIELGEAVLSFDWETMKLIPREVIYTDKDMGKTYTEYDVWAFDDGTVIKTVHPHEFFNVERGKMAYMSDWSIGDHGYKIDGTKPCLISHEVIKETVKHYKISLEGSTNFFANGLLNGDRHNPKGIKLPKYKET